MTSSVDKIKRLAAEMVERQRREQERKYSQEPSVAPARESFILFLGQGCAKAAGMPSLKEIAHKVFDDLFEWDHALATSYLRDDDRLDEDKLSQAFYKMLRDMPSIESYTMLHSFYSQVPVPVFYQDLASLIKAGYFSHILTTSIDSLLEQALNGAGLWENTHYRVINLGGDPDEEMEPPGGSGSQITIIKLHGELKLDVDAEPAEFMITPEELIAAIESQRGFIKGKLMGDIVMVGYEFECPPVSRWLTNTFGELWWVSPDPPPAGQPSEQLAQIEQARQVTYIHGAEARPEQFFGHLALILLRLSLPEAITSYVEEQGSRPAVAGLTPGAPVARDISQVDADKLREKYLRDQYRRCQSVLYNLETAAVQGERNPQLQAQIEYQRNQLTQIEAELRKLSSSQPAATELRVIELMEQITKAAQRAITDVSTVSFLQKQLHTVKKEYARDTPNQHVVSAAIGATTVLAERLGSKVVDLQLVRDLASFAPSIMTRGM